MVEIWFGIISRKALRGGSFKSLEDLEQVIKDFCEAYNLDSKPFVLSKLESEEQPAEEYCEKLMQLSTRRTKSEEAWLGIPVRDQRAGM